MKTSDKGIAALVAHEGIVPAPYLDSVGVLTFGIGHTAAAGPPDPASLRRGMPADLDAALREVFRVFRADLARFEADVLRVLAGRTVPQHEFDAAVSFHFNTGAIGRASWVKEWLAGRKDAAAGLMMQWRRPAAIIPRREAERDLFRDGTYPAGLATVWQVDRNARVIWTPARRLTCDQVLDLLRPEATLPPAITLESLATRVAALEAAEAARKAAP